MVVDLFCGIVRFVGWDVCEVVGVIGYFDIDYCVKGIVVC